MTPYGVTRAAQERRLSAVACPSMLGSDSASGVYECTPAQPDSFYNLLPPPPAVAAEAEEAGTEQHETARFGHGGHLESERADIIRIKIFADRVGADPIQAVHRGR